MVQATEFNPRGRALREIGFTGEFNLGGGQSGAGFLAQNPDLRNQFDAARARFKAEELNPTSATGVVPIGQIEPLTALQRQGITGIAKGTPARGFQKGSQKAFQTVLEQIPQFQANIDPLLQQVAKGGESIQQAQAPITQQEFDIARQRFSNPFQQQVIDRAISNINRQEAIRQSALSRAAQAGQAFGGTAQAVQGGILGGEALRSIGDISAALEQQNFQQSVQNALQQLNAERNRQLAGGQATGNLAAQGGGLVGMQLTGAGQLQNLAKTGAGLTTANIQNFLNQQNARIGAGSLIQQQNQGVLDLINQQEAAQFAEPERQLRLALDIIRSFTGGGGGGQSTTGGDLQRIIGGGVLGANLGGKIPDFLSNNTQNTSLLPDNFTLGIV